MARHSSSGTPAQVCIKLARLARKDTLTSRRTSLMHTIAVFHLETEQLGVPIAVATRGSDGFSMTTTASGHEMATLTWRWVEVRLLPITSFLYTQGIQSVPTSRSRISSAQDHCCPDSPCAVWPDRLGGR